MKSDYLWIIGIFPLLSFSLAADSSSNLGWSSKYDCRCTVESVLVLYLIYRFKLSYFLVDLSGLLSLGRSYSLMPHDSHIFIGHYSLDAV